MKTVGQDYDNSGSHVNITIPATVTSVPFDITIFDNYVLEANETFTLTISTSTVSSNNVTIGDISQTTVIILDDDSKLAVKYQNVYIHMYACT